MLLGDLLGQVKIIIDAATGLVAGSKRCMWLTLERASNDRKQSTLDFGLTFDNSSLTTNPCKLVSSF